MAVSDCIRTCWKCGCEFRRTSKGQHYRYCSDECFARRCRRGRQKGFCASPGCTHRAKCRNYCATHYNRLWKYGAPVLPSPTCEMCGAAYSTEGRGLGVRRRYCSPECSANAVRASNTRKDASRRSALLVGDKIDPIAVFKRDKWRCHLCKRQTLKAKRGTYDDRAPELDHIIALADGGSHTWGNVACSCRKCNASKQANSRGQLGLPFAA